jgi:hypothetical protein
VNSPPHMVSPQGLQLSPSPNLNCRPKILDRSIGLVIA